MDARARLISFALLMVAVVVVLPGCMASPVSLADSTIPLQPGGYTELGEAAGNAVGVLVFGIPLSEPDPAGRARDRAVASHENADGLINVSCEHQVYSLIVLPIVITVTRVYGTAVQVN